MSNPFETLGGWRTQVVEFSKAVWAGLRPSNGRIQCVTIQGHVVCAVWGGVDDDEVKAAQLIAAAPYLLEAVKMALNGGYYTGQRRKDVMQLIAYAEDAK